MGRSIYACRMSEESKWFLEDFNSYKYGSEVNLEKWVEFPFGRASVYLRLQHDCYTVHYDLDWKHKYIIAC